ncbi:MAG: hypothetical protein ACW972_05430 [Promethearchaeota archaeon]|jgi:hypothetical protein
MMNDLVLLSLIIFIFVRITGLAASIDFFHNTKDKKFIYITIGWLFWIIASIFPIFSSLVENTNIIKLFLVLNALFGLIGALFYTWGFYKYFITIQRSRVILLAIVVTVLLPVLLYVLVNFRMSIQFSALMLNFLIFGVYIFPHLYVKDLKKILGKSYVWYIATFVSLIFFIPVYIIISLSGYNYGLYEAENSLLIILYYVPTITSSILFIILLVHLEYTISSSQKFDLKDKYSHNLGNIMQVINSSSDLISLTDKLNEQDKKSLKLIQKKCKEASKLIKNIRKL